MKIKPLIVLLYLLNFCLLINCAENVNHLLDWAINNDTEKFVQLDDMEKFEEFTQLYKERLNETDNDGKTILHWIMKHDNSSMAWVLFGLVNANSFNGVILNLDLMKTDNNGDTWLHVAAKNNSHKALYVAFNFMEQRYNLFSKKYCLEIVNCRNKINDMTPLMVASQLGHFEIVMQLLENNANPTIAVENNEKYLTAIDFVAKENTNIKNLLEDKMIRSLINAQQYMSCDKKEVERLSLIEAGIDVNAISNTNSILHIAVKKNDLEVIKLLLESKANKNHKNEFDFSAITYAISRNQQDVIKLLLDAGADLEVGPDQQFNWLITRPDVENTRYAFVIRHAQELAQMIHELTKMPLPLAKVIVGYQIYGDMKF